MKSGVEHPPEIFESLSSSISGNPLISGMRNMGSGNAAAAAVMKGDPPVAFSSLFKSVKTFKKGVQTGVTAAVKAGKDNLETELGHPISPNFFLYHKLNLLRLFRPNLHN